MRHGPTAWNAAKRLQGTSDIPLSAAGHARVAGWSLPRAVLDWRWSVSPLSRARETAALLGAPPSREIEPALIELSFGGWEGRTLDALRADAADAMRRNEGRGLDMTPPGGESPRQAMARLRPWLARTAADGRDTIAVSHKGLIRVVLAMATGWDMTGRQPARLDWSRVHLFRVGAGGAPEIDRLNLPLDGAAWPP
ncbi:MAG: histidine phosphatase family protein [Rhodospirillales bacterium]|nr:MAG: histidine phosphatase family protein [Rhodospirillales bacterium]